MHIPLGNTANQHLPCDALRSCIFVSLWPMQTTVTLTMCLKQTSKWVSWG